MAAKPSGNPVTWRTYRHRCPYVRRVARRTDPHRLAARNAASSFVRALCSLGIFYSIVNHQFMVGC